MDALQRRTTYGYDSAGQQTLRIDGRSLRTTYFYDAEGKTTGWKYQDQTRATQVYDAVGQRTRVQDWTGRYTYSFDAVGRQALAVDSFSKRITYGYDAVGQRAKMREPDEGRFTYWYVSVGQITRLLNPFAENTTFSYDVAGRRTMQKLANRVRASYSYDAADRLTTLANVRADATYVSRYDYAYDNTMNMTRVIEADGTRVTWSYDRTYQLTRERRSGVNAYDTTYTYDAAQNRRLMIDSGTRATYLCDSANQLNWLQDGTGRTTFGYDANGNQCNLITPDNQRTTLSWDYANHLLNMSVLSGIRTTFSSNFSNTISKVETQDNIRSFTWDKKTILREMSSNQSVSVVSSNTFSPSTKQLISRTDSSTRFYLSDSTNSVRHVIDMLSDNLNSYLYNYFGVEVDDIGSECNDFRFNGMSGWITYLISHLYVNNLSAWYYPTVSRQLSHRYSWKTVFSPFDDSPKPVDVEISKINCAKFMIQPPPDPTVKECPCTWPKLFPANVKGDIDRLIVNIKRYCKKDFKIVFRCWTCSDYGWSAGAGGASTPSGCSAVEVNVCVSGNQVDLGRYLLHELIHASQCACYPSYWNTQKECYVDLVKELQAYFCAGQCDTFFECLRRAVPSACRANCRPESIKSDIEKAYVWWINTHRKCRIIDD